MVNKMTEQDYIDIYGILLDDVLESRERALKKGKVSFVDDLECKKCGNNKLEKFYATNSDKCWKDLCGRDGMCIFCNKCMDIVEFRRMGMS